MSKFVATVVLVLFAGQASALGRGKAIYVGGTVANVADKTEGRVDLKSEQQLRFTAKTGTVLDIPWAAVEEVEYGQKAGRRVVMAVALSPLALFSKNRRHYVTFTWKESDGQEQAAVLQFDKEDIRPALSIIRVRTGKTITFQDEEARKQLGGGEGSGDKK